MDTEVLAPSPSAPASRTRSPDSEAIRELRRRRRIFQRARAFDPTLPPGLVVERAMTRDDLEQAYRLVHDSYVEAGYMDPHPTGLRVRAFSALPHAAMFVAKLNGRVIGTGSMIADSPLGLPMEKSFRKEIRALRAQGRRIIEGSDLAVAKEHRNLRILTEVTRCAISYALYVGADDMVLAISPEHSGYFQGVAQFDHLGDARSYSNEKADIVEGKRLKLLCLAEKYLSIDAALGADAFLHEFFFEGCPYHQRHPQWHRLALAAMRDPRLFTEFFVEMAGLLERCSEKELRVLQGYHKEVDIMALAKLRSEQAMATRLHPVLEAFRHAAELVPAYRAILAECGVDVAQIDTLERFREVVPILDRASTFGRFSTADLCVEERMDHERDRQ